MIAIMDIFPATRGHALVIPRAHAADIRDGRRATTWPPSPRVAQRLAVRAYERLGADGVTVMQSNGAAAWQTVFHYHVHVIPRYDGDPLVLPWTPGDQPAHGRRPRAGGSGVSVMDPRICGVDPKIG